MGDGDKLWQELDLDRSGNLSRKEFILKFSRQKKGGEDSTIKGPGPAPPVKSDPRTQAAVNAKAAGSTGDSGATPSAQMHMGTNVKLAAKDKGAATQSPKLNQPTTIGSGPRPHLTHFVE